VRPHRSWCPLSDPRPVDRGGDSRSNPLSERHPQCRALHDLNVGVSGLQNMPSTAVDPFSTRSQGPVYDHRTGLQDSLGTVQGSKGSASWRIARSDWHGYGHILRSLSTRTSTVAARCGSWQSRLKAIRCSRVYYAGHGAYGIEDPLTSLAAGISAVSPTSLI